MHGTLPAVVPAERMTGQRQPGQRVIIPLQADRRRIPDLGHDLDAGTGLADAEALAREDLPVALRMELREALAELEFIPVDGERPVRALLPLHGILRQAVRIDAQEVADAGLLQAQVSGHPVETHHMDDVLLHRAEDPLEHVVEVNADVGGDAAALMDIPLPGGVVPFPTGGDVREVDVIDFVRRAFVHLLLEGGDPVVQAELEDIVGLVARLLLHLLEGVDVVGIQDHRFLADDVAAEAETVADERVVRIVRGADGHPVQRLVALHQLGAVAVEKFMLREKGAVREETVQPPDAVKLVVCGEEVVPRVLDRLEMPGGDVTRRPDECKVLHGLCFLVFGFVVMVVMLLQAPALALALSTFLVIAAIAILVAVAVAIAVTVTIAVAISVAVAVALAVAVLLLVLDVVQDDVHVREGAVVLEFLQVRQHPLVHELGTEHEHGHVRETLEDVGIGHDTGRDRVDDDEVIPLAERFHELVHPAGTQQLSRVRRQGTSEDGIHAFREDIVLDEGIDVVGPTYEVLREARLPLHVQVAGQGTLTEIQVQQDDLLLHHRQAGRQVRGDEGLPGVLHQGQEQVRGSGLVDIASEFHIGTQDSERLRYRVSFLLQRHQLPLVAFLLGGNFAEDGDVRVGLHVLAEADLGVEDSLKSENQERNQQAEENTHEDALFGIRGNRCGIYPGPVHYASVALDGGLADEKFLALAEEGQVQFLLDALHAGDVVNVELPARNLAHLLVGTLAHSLHGPDLLLDGANVGSQELVQVALESTQFRLQVPNDRIIGGTGLLVLVQLEDQLIELRNRGFDVLVLDIDCDREQAVLGIRVRELHQVLRMGNLRLQPLHLFRGFDTGREIGLTVLLQVQDLVVPLEVRDLRLFGAQFAVQLRNPGIDVFRSLLDDVLLLLDRVVIIDGNHLVDDVCRPLWVRIPEGEIHDTVRLAVPLHLHAVPVHVGHIHDVPVGDHDRVIIVQFPEGPGGMHDDAAIVRGEGVVQTAFYRLVAGCFHDDCGVLAYRDFQRSIIRFLEVRQFHVDGGILVQVLHALDQLGLILVLHPEVQALGHFQHRGLGGDDDNLVVDGIHGNRHPAVRDILQHGGAVVEAVPRHGVNLDTGMALIDAVCPVGDEIGHEATDEGAEENPMDVPRDRNDDILRGQRVRVFLLKEGEIGILGGSGHSKQILITTAI